MPEPHLEAAPQVRWHLVAKHNRLGLLAWLTHERETDGKPGQCPPMGHSGRGQSLGLACPCEENPARHRDVNTGYIAWPARRRTPPLPEPTRKDERRRQDAGRPGEATQRDASQGQQGAATHERSDPPGTAAVNVETEQEAVG